MGSRWMPVVALGVLVELRALKVPVVALLVLAVPYSATEAASAPSTVLAAVLAAASCGSRHWLPEDETAF